jgi:LPXTG-motif cell wall-anchored protein
VEERKEEVQKEAVVTPEPAPAPEQVVEEQPQPEPVQLAQNVPPPAPEPLAAPAPAPEPAPAELPKTASPYPLFGLAGLLSVGLYSLLRVKRLS